MVMLRVVLILLAFIILFILGWQNQTTTTVQVFFRTFYDVPLAFVMLYSFAFGALCVGIFTIISEIRLRARLHKQRQEIDALTEELRTLRNLPLDVINSSDTSATKASSPENEKNEEGE